MFLLVNAATATSNVFAKLTDELLRLLRIPAAGLWGLGGGVVISTPHFSLTGVFVILQATFE